LEESNMKAAERRALGTAEEVAEYLGVPVATLYQWRYHDKGPRASKVGRHIRYRWADVEAWLDSQA
jgi:excisionase family DNA binding protein